MSGIELKELTLQNSSDTALKFDNVRDIVLEDISLVSNNKGQVYNYCSEISLSRVLVVTSVDNGTEFNNVGFCEFPGLSNAANGGHGLVMNDVDVMPFTASSSVSNTGDGVNITSGTDVPMQIEASANGGQGIESVSGGENIVIQDGSIIEGNTGDGVKFTATTDDSKVVVCKIKDNGGYGVNIANANCNDNIIDLNTYGNNTSGPPSNTITPTP